MKIFLTSRIAATVSLAFTACVSVSAEAFTVAKRGEKAACVVAVPASPSACLKHAAGEFSAYVKRMTGVELPVVTGDPGGKPAVRLVSGVKLGRDSFRFRTSGSDFLIEGDDDRSVLFGVYDFLENRCGCDWLSADQEIVPARDTIEVADGFELLRKPAFRIRESSYSDMRHSPDFAAKMKLNGYMFNGRWKDIHGGAPAECFDPWLGKCHTFMRLLPPEKYFKDHPEYYAEVNGKREYAKRMQLCLTNPDVVRIGTSNVLARIAKMYPKVKIFGVSQSDRMVFCTCKNCAAVDAREESHAGTNIEFVNKIADAVAEKYPDVLIETLAYQYTCKPPKFVRPRPNVMICLCSDNCDFSMPLGKSRYRFRNMNDFVDDLKWWCAEAKHVYVWNYTMNFRYYMHAFPNVYCLKPDLETFLDCGVTEVYEQGVKSPHQALTALKTYLIGHLLWDPRQPLEPLLERFYRGYYGAAAPWIRRYVEELHAMSRDRDEVRHPMKMWGVVDSPALKTEFFDRGAEYLAKAAEAVKDDPVRLRNVQWEMNANDYTRIMRSGMISALRRDGKYPLSPKMKELQSAARRIAADWKAFPKTARVSEDTKVLEVSKRRIEAYAGFDPFKADVGKCVDVPAAELVDWSGGKYLKLGFSDIHVDTGSVCRVKAYVKVDLPADAKPDDKVFGMIVRGQPKTGRSYRVKDLKPGPYGFGWYELRNPCDVRDGGYYIFEKYGKYPVEVKKVRVAFADVTDWFIGVDAPLPLGTNGVSDTAAFVKTVTNRAEVAKAEWTVTGLGIFRVWVNGTETGTEDFLKPGLTHVDKRRSTFTYDVTELMKKPAGGTNVFAAEVSGGWWRDRVASAPYVRRKTESGFYGVLKVTYADGSVTEVPTDETWRAAYYSPVTHAEIYWGEDFDSRVKADWRRTGDVDWPAAKLNLEFSGELTPMEGRSIKVRRDLTLAPKSVYVWKGAEGAAEDRFGKAKILRHGELSGKVDLMPGETLVVDFGQNASGVPEFTAVAESGTVLCARPAEMLNDSEGEKVRGNDGPAGSAYFANYRKTRTSVQYVFSGAGAETYMPTFSFFGGRYFSFTATAKVSFSSIRFLPVMSIAREDETGVLVTGHEGTTATLRLPGKQEKTLRSGIHEMVVD